MNLPYVEPIRMQMSEKPRLQPIPYGDETIMIDVNDKREMYPGEEWAPIKGWEGEYEASTYGRVKSVDRYSGRGKRKRFVKGTVMNQMVNFHGYLIVKFRSQLPQRVHRLVALAHIRRRPNRNQINHINGIKDYNYVGNLEWVTNQENGIHANKYGLKTNGKLTEDQVRLVFDMKRKGATQKEMMQKLLDDFGISICRRTLGYCLKGHHYRYVKLYDTGTESDHHYIRRNAANKNKKPVK